MNAVSLSYRHQPLPSDVEIVERIVRSTGRFNEEEVRIARELVTEALERGEASGYLYVFALCATDVVGFTCYGPIPGSQRRYELYWIAVHAGFQGRGIGHSLLAETERLIAARGGVRVYAETSSRADYGPTHAFYRAEGYKDVAFLDGYYGDTDGLIVFEKRLSGVLSQVGPALSKLSVPSGMTEVLSSVVSGAQPQVSRAA